MKCPVCQASAFEQKTLEIGLQVSTCTICKGYWIRSNQFWTWKNNHHSSSAPILVGCPPVKATDSRAQKICPECFKILSHYQVGKGTNVTIDRCETCRGMWLDKNEFDLLSAKNLVKDIHRIFSTQWQSAVKMEKILENRAQALKREIGVDDYRRVEDFLQWVKVNQKKTSIMAYLNYVS